MGRLWEWLGTMAMDWTTTHGRPLPSLLRAALSHTASLPLPQHHNPYLTNHSDTNPSANPSPFCSMCLFPPPPPHAQERAVQAVLLLLGIVSHPSRLLIPLASLHPPQRHTHLQDMHPTTATPLRPLPTQLRIRWPVHFGANR